MIMENIKLINNLTYQIINIVQNKISTYNFNNYSILNTDNLEINEGTLLPIIPPTKYIKELNIVNVENNFNIVQIIQYSNEEKIIIDENIQLEIEEKEFKKGFEKYNKYIRTIVLQEYVKVGGKFKEYSDNLLVDKPDYDVIEDENLVKSNITYLRYVSERDGFLLTNGIISNIEPDIKVEQYPGITLEIKDDPRNKANETYKIFIASYSL